MREQSSVPLGLIHFVRFQAEIAGTAQTLCVHDSNVRLLTPVRGGELSRAAQGHYLGKIRS